MTDNKQYPYPPQDGVGQAPPYPGGPAGYPPYPVAGLVNPGYGMTPDGMAGFGGPGQGVGMMGPAPPMGFHLPPPTQPLQPPSDDERYKYSSGGESGNSYGDINGFDFSEKTIRRAFIRLVLLITSALHARTSLTYIFV